MIREYRLTNGRETVERHRATRPLERQPAARRYRQDY